MGWQPHCTPSPSCHLQWGSGRRTSYRYSRSPRGGVDPQALGLSTQGFRQRARKRTRTHSKWILNEATYDTTVRSGPWRERVLRNEWKRDTIDHRQKNGLQERVSWDQRSEFPADQGHVRLGHRVQHARASLLPSFRSAEGFRTNSRIKCRIRRDTLRARS